MLNEAASIIGFILVRLDRIKYQTLVMYQKIMVQIHKIHKIFYPLNRPTKYLKEQEFIIHLKFC